VAVSTPLAGKRIFITGGARGIGLALAEATAAADATPIIADIDADAAVAAAVRLGRGSRGYGLDVTDRSAFGRVLEQAENDTGPVDVLVNNAGVAEASSRLGDQPDELIDRMIEVNLGGVLNGTVSALRLMAPRGRGHIINVASQAGRTAVPALAAYAASKHGVVGLTDSVRLEYRGSGLRFSCVMPGPVDTGMMTGTRKVPLIRLITPDSVAHAILDAVGTGREEVFIPRSTGYLVRFAGMLPVRARETITRASGIDRVYSEIDPSARADYSERTRRQMERDGS
jgi:NAD(P)-dependent dehydrogenase (short-subunit alcohol dehydrogenase family)